MPDSPNWVGCSPGPDGMTKVWDFESRRTHKTSAGVSARKARAGLAPEPPVGPVLDYRDVLQWDLGLETGWNGAAKEEGGARSSLRAVLANGARSTVRAQRRCRVVRCRHKAGPISWLFARWHNARRSQEGLVKWAYGCAGTGTREAIIGCTWPRLSPTARLATGARVMIPWKIWDCDHAGV